MRCISDDSVIIPSVNLNFFEPARVTFFFLVPTFWALAIVRKIPDRPGRPPDEKRLSLLALIAFAHAP